MKPLGIYIHIPFCVRKCRYCDFSSYPINDPDTHLSYIMQVIFELRARRARLAEAVGGPQRAPSIDPGNTPVVDTIYLGGGTPSLIEPAFITELLDAVYTTYRVMNDAEVTIEVNPGTADVEKFRRYRAAGINRLSIGAQSFDTATLSFLGRVHSAEDTVRCLMDARKAGFGEVSLDLIFGVPGQTFAAWERDLELALAFDPSHISFYSLQIEEGTPLFDGYINGAFEALDDIRDRRMYHYAKKYLAKNGFFHYEISNSARPGRVSRHNLKYWSMEPYAGFGAGAHSYYGGKRFSNKAGLAAYLTAEDDSEMTERVHENTLTDDMSEFIFLGLRRTAGIELSRFSARFGKDFWELYGEETKRLIGRGLLQHRGGTLRLTALGLDLANSVFIEYV